MTPATLATQWRDEAALMRRRGLEEAARLVESLAAELEAALREHQLEVLTMRRAAAESGFSYSGIEKAVRSGRLPNAGTKGAPRVRRRDLPRKVRTADGPGLAAKLRSV